MNLAARKKAEADLAAAAPDLLGALKEIYETLENGGFFVNLSAHLEARMRTAIEKAEGRR